MDIPSFWVPEVGPGTLQTVPVAVWIFSGPSTPGNANFFAKWGKKRRTMPIAEK